ncbi:MAG: glycosyltransferase family 2 protein [Maricaulaceae bacterium]|jgi:glycosyltransferase involved in cell wall biosynthesis
MTASADIAASAPEQAPAHAADAAEPARGPAEELPLVAVTTPVYNGEEFLAETMDAVQAQTWPNLVHVVIDNASTDSTPEILARYQNARVPVIVHRNPETIPMNPNWNRAVEMVPKDAAYFRVLAADDLIDPTSTEKMVRLAMRDPEIGVVGAYTRKSDNPPIRALPKDQEVFDGTEIARGYMTFDHNCLWANHLLFRRDFADRFVPFYDPAFHHDDVERALGALIGEKYGFVHEYLAFTRVHENTHSNSIAYADSSHIREWVMMLKRYAPELFPAPRAKRLIRSQLFKYYREVLNLAAHGDTARYRAQMEHLERLGHRPRPWDFAAALAEFVPGKALRLVRRKWKRLTAR